ncbi:hypothetical protein FNF29_07595 [Cafeteria roenbergensis]|uniref:Magnesium transporter n=1 Tax=Cafeteria roenbergensis TaxID=33653 RepID=A0A5A8C2T8_CAFRO|nr:hypothetical protein FNF29_07595 [Cafeteria roenbergensis]|eukprot:KAA0147105.1 hypothetical protein FNF29_07595 [Cafeteria roenbergensis]
MCDPTAEPDVGSPLVFVGVAMSAVATIAGNAGLNMQKWGFLIEAKKPAKERVHFVKMWKWWAGFVLVVVGAIMDFVSYGLAPSSIVTPVGSLTLVVNIFLAHWWLGENIYMQDYVGTFFIVAGATMTVVFGNQSDSCLPVSELAARYATTGMIVYMACAVAIVAAMFVLQRRAEGVLKRVVRLYQDGRISGAASDTVEIEVGSEEPASPAVSPSGTAEGWIASSLRDVGWISDPPAGAAVAPEPRSPNGAQAMRRSRAISGHVRCIDDILPSEPAATIVPAEAARKARSGSHQTASPSAAEAASGARGLAPRPAAVVVPRSSGTGPAPPGDGPDSKLGVLVQSGRAASGERSAADAGTGAGAGASSAAPEAKDAAGDSSSEEGSPAASPTSSQHVVDPPSAYEPYAQWHPVSVSVLAGTLGAQTVLFAKSVAETIKTTAGGDSQLDQPAPYLFLLALVFFIVVQQMWLAHALRFFDAAFVVPVFQGTYIAVSVLGGVAYFQELNGLSTVNLIMFPISVLVVLFGVYVLSTRKMGGMRAQLFKDADEEEDAKSDARTGAGTSSPATPALSAPAASTARKPAGPAPAGS